MDSYLELRLLPDPEFSASTLMSELFTRLHHGLVNHGEGRVGISFPDVEQNGIGLGRRLRLHGSPADLEHLMSANWLRGLHDHLTCSPINPVPALASHRVVRRVQAKSSPARERRRLMARKGISLEAATQAIPEITAERLQLPYVVLNSQSTRQRFRLYIEHLPPQSNPVQGRFNAYGLSSATTIPWF